MNLRCRPSTLSRQFGGRWRAGNELLGGIELLRDNRIGTHPFRCGLEGMGGDGGGDRRGRCVLGQRSAARMLMGVGRTSVPLAAHLVANKSLAIRSWPRTHA